MGQWFSKKKPLAEPFTHKCKMKGLEELRGPDDKEHFIVLNEKESFDTDVYSIRFRYNIETDNEWHWEYTPHPDQRLWYSVKEEYYEIPRSDLSKFPYNSIVDTDSIISVPNMFNDDCSKTEEDEMKNGKNEDSAASNPCSSVYSHDPRTPMVQVRLPQTYDAIRQTLRKRDPIPPHIFRKYELSTDAYQEASRSSLIDCKSIRCRFATKDLAPDSMVREVQKHPILMFFDKEPEKIEDVVWILHLVQDTSTMKAKVEFQPKLWKKFSSDEDGWTVSKDIVELHDISLLDIAKWCVQYEKSNPDYTELYNNCRRFMVRLSDYIKLQWGDALMVEKVWYSIPSRRDNDYSKRSRR